MPAPRRGSAMPGLQQSAHGREEMAGESGPVRDGDEQGDQDQEADGRSHTDGVAILSSPHAAVEGFRQAPADAQNADHRDNHNPYVLDRRATIRSQRQGHQVHDSCCQGHQADQPSHEPRSLGVLEPPEPLPLSDSR